MTATRYKVSFSDDKNILELVEVLTAQHCECTRCMDSKHFIMVTMVNFMLCEFCHKKKNAILPHISLVNLDFSYNNTL